jgi:signal transduction histidine kinase
LHAKRERSDAGGSLRSILLQGTATLLTIALLTLAVAMLIWLPRTPSPPILLLSLISLIVADVALVLLFGDYLLRRQFVGPVETMVGEAEMIAEGDFTRRLHATGADELRRLAESVNRMANRLIENQAQLKDNVRSLDSTNRELSLARRELIQAEKLVTVGRLAAGIAHEVGNPLGAIVGYLEVARRRGNGNEEWVDGVSREADRIDRVIRGLLDFARPTPSHSKEVCINGAVESAVGLLEDQGRFKRIRLELDLENPTPVVFGDSTHLEQILVNLLLNAADAIHEVDAPGRIVVRTSTAPFGEVRQQPAPRRQDDPEGVTYAHLRENRRSPEAADRFEARQLVASIEVSDNGAGIDPEHLVNIFEPFYTTKDPGRGSGLGLAVSARLAEQMKGAMAADSTSAEGTRFTLLLPCTGTSTGEDSIEGAA